jgi:hypothetical protein
VPLEKKFPQHFTQKLLILLTLPREAAAAAPLYPLRGAMLVRFCAASLPAGLGGERRCPYQRCSLRGNIFQAHSAGPGVALLFFRLAAPAILTPGGRRVIKIQDL